MSEGVRYYWLKLQATFFTSKRIKKLRRMPKGATYVIIYIKMQLLALKTEGVLVFTNLESDFATELALDLDEDPDDVRATLEYLLSCGLCETADNISFLLPWVVANTGSEGSSAERMRKKRAAAKLSASHSAEKCALSDGEQNIEKKSKSESEEEGFGGKERRTPASLDFSTAFPHVYQHPTEQEFEDLREKALRQLDHIK